MKNQLAFPCQYDEYFPLGNGMTLRDYFAAKAMHGIIAGIDPQMNYEEIATRAYQYADAMIEVRGEWCRFLMEKRL